MIVKLNVNRNFETADAQIIEQRDNANQYFERILNES